MIKILKDSRILEESTFSSLEKIDYKSTPEVSFERMVTLNEWSSEESSSSRIFKEVSSSGIFDEEVKHKRNV